MNCISEINTITWYFLLSLLIFAACYDWKDYYIPNWIIYAGYGIGFIYQSIFFGFIGSIFWLQGILFPIILLFIFFYCRMIGAGDIKLFSMIGGVSGVYSIIDIMTVSLFFGALLSVMFILRYRNLRSRLQYLLAYFSNIVKQKRILPYVQQMKGEWNRKKHIKEGHIHYSMAILCAVIYCQWGNLGNSILKILIKFLNF